MKDARFAKFVVGVNGAVPLAILGWDAWRHQLGANPIAYALHTTGMLALVFLMLTLCVTPARKLSGANMLSHFRRTLGLYAFFYAAVHLGIYFVFDRQARFGAVISDLALRPFIRVGMCTFLLMVPLAVTSTNGMIKRLGGLQWKKLHRLVYLVAIGAVVHYYEQVKADIRLPLIFAGVLAVLLAFRVVTEARGAMKRAFLARTARMARQSSPA